MASRRARGEHVRRLEPGVERPSRVAGDRLERGFGGGDSRLHELVLPLFAGGPDQQRGGRRGAREVRVEAGLVDAVEEGEHRIVVALRDRVELVVVAARALHREAEHRGPERVHAIDDVLGAELLFDAAALVRLPVQSIEGRGDTLLARGGRQEIAGELPGEELIVRQVVVERADDPVAIRRHVAVDVGLVAVRVGVSREIEPVHRHPLAVRRRGQVVLDGAGVRAGRSIAHERVDVGGRRREAGQVERETADDDLGRGRRRRREAFGVQPRAHERIDRVRTRVPVTGTRHADRVDRDERPMRPVVRTLDDPSLEQRLVRRRQRQVRLGRRHPVVLVVCIDAPDELALARVARLDDRPPFADVVELLQHALAQVEAQLRFPLPGIGAVAAEAAIGEQRPDLVTEIDATGVRRTCLAEARPIRARRRDGLTRSR